MRKCSLTSEEVVDTQRRIFALLYIDTQPFYEQIASLARMNSYLQSPSRVQVIVDETFLPSDMALSFCEFCSSFDVYGATKQQFLSQLRKNTLLPLVCDIDVRFHQLATVTPSTRKVFFIVQRFALDLILTRQQLFRLSPRYVTDIKRSQLRDCIQALQLHDALYQRSQGCDLMAILHDFYFNGAHDWCFVAVQAVSIQIIKSFLTQSDKDATQCVDQRALRSDIQYANLCVRKRSKTSYIVCPKHLDLSQQLIEHFTARRALLKVFTYLDLCYSDLAARLFITDALSCCVMQSGHELCMVERAIRAVSWLRTAIPVGKLDVCDIFIPDVGAQPDYDLPEVFLDTASNIQFSAQQDARDSSISD